MQTGGDLAPPHTATRPGTDLFLSTLNETMLFEDLLYIVKNFRMHSSTGGKHKACGPNPALHLLLSGPAPCFYPVAALSSLPLVREQLHVHSPKLHSAL